MTETPSGEATIDVIEWLSRATLDIIGLAGFSYEFDAISQGETNELVRAFKELVMPDKSVRGQFCQKRITK